MSRASTLTKLPIGLTGDASGNISTVGTFNGLTVGKGAGAVANNTAVGASALAANTTGAGNNAFGYQALSAITTGNYNVGIGNAAVGNTTTGSNNTGIGYAALINNTTASYNTAVGYQAGYSGTTSPYNTCIGYKAGFATDNATGLNTFVGFSTGDAVTTGYANTFVGGNAGDVATTGAYNVFVGYNAGGVVSTGSKNTIIGSYTGNQGGLDIRTASNVIVLSDGDGNPRLYYSTVSGSWRSIEIYNNTTGTALGNVVIDANGTLYRSTSAAKYKQDIRDIEEIDVNLLRPVRYKSACANDDQTIDHFGVIADEVHAAGLTELVNYGADGEIEGFAYERLTVVLLKKLQVLEANGKELKAKFDAYKEAHP